MYFHSNENVNHKIPYILVSQLCCHDMHKILVIWYSSIKLKQFVIFMEWVFGMKNHM